MARPTRSPTKAGTFTFKVIAHDDHAEHYERDDATRVPYNMAESNPVSIAVAPASAMQLESSENPKGVVVPSGNGIMSVTPKYEAYGKPTSFAVSGADKLPPGITFKTNGTGVYFSGKFNGTTQQMGSYTGITVRATDALGRTASLPVSFNVFLSSDAIGLTLEDVTTKVGYPVVMTSVADNYYGKLRFYSYDLSGPLASQVGLDGATGVVSGKFTSVADHVMNVYVTDATNRVTSKPLKIKVIPDLRITVPTTVEAEQSRAVDRTILTDYRLGKVTYEKANPAAWPTGFDVDPNTGSILNANVTNASGTYPGLRIRATDTFQSAGIDQTDTELSNVFSIVVTDITAAPVIAVPGKTVLGSTTDSASFTPSVYDDVTFRPWTYEGTTYEANHDLSQYGLGFDPKTGRITGKATKPFIIDDFVITVTSAKGAESSTGPFWLGVAPADPIVPTAGQPLTLVSRAGAPFPQNPALFDNVMGKRVHTIQGGWSLPYAFDRDTGAITATGSWPDGKFLFSQSVDDEFGRRGLISRYFVSGKALSLTGLEVKATIGRQMTSVATTTAAGVIGTASFVVSGLPAGTNYDPATGAISGTVAAEGSYPLTVSITDSEDGAKSFTTVTLVASVVPSGPRYWRATWNVEYSYPARIEQFRLLDAKGGNVVPAAYNSGTAKAITAGVYARWGDINSIYQASQGAVHVLGRYIGIDLGPNPPTISTMSILFYGGTASGVGDVTFSYSTDGKEWVPFAHDAGRPFLMNANWP